MIEALQKGEIVDNPTVWKERSLLANKIAAGLSALVVILKVLEVDLPLDDETIIAISGGLAALWFVGNNVIATITSRKIGSK